MTRALVTGANGFLGSYIVQQLVERGYSVRALMRRKDELVSGMGVETAQADVRNLESVEAACEGIDIVFHVAAISGIWGSWKMYHGTNTVGTRNVVEACIRQKVPRLVYTSSPSVTFNGDHQFNQNETAPYAKRWLCNYPHSKALAEQYVLEANEEGTLMTCALRPHLIWGPRDKHLIPRLVERAKSKKLRRVGDGTNEVDSIFVENAAMAHLMAADALQPGSPVCGSAYFLSQDEPVNCWSWINDILQLAGLPRVRKSISFTAAYRLAIYWSVTTRSSTSNPSLE